MRYQRNTLLAGIAALALIAGAGLASAQEQSQDHHGTPQVKEPHAAAQPMNKAPAAARIGPSAQQEKSGAMMEQPNRRADEMNSRDQDQGRREPSRSDRAASGRCPCPG